MISKANVSIVTLNQKGIKPYQIFQSFSAILVVVVAFFAGLESPRPIQFHQPIVACTLIGLVTGNLEAGLCLVVAKNGRPWLGNIGAAVAFLTRLLRFCCCCNYHDQGGNFTTEEYRSRNCNCNPLLPCSDFLDYDRSLRSPSWFGSHCRCCC